MAHIVEFTVEGLAGRKTPYSQKLNKDINVFFGLNGGGKTSLLKILDAAMSIDAKTLVNVPFSYARVVVFSLGRNTTFTYELTKTPQPELPELLDAGIVDRYGDVKAASQERTQTLKWKQTPSDYVVRRWRHQFLPISRMYLPVGSSTISPAKQFASAEERLDLQFAESLERLWSSYAADISSTVREAQQKGLARILSEVLTKDRWVPNEKIIEPKSAYKRVSAFLNREPGFSRLIGSESEFVSRYQKEPQLQSVVRDIDEVEQTIEEATRPREELKKLIENLYTGKQIFLGDKGIEVTIEGNIKIGLPSLSSGEKQLLRILISVLGTQGGAVLVDEPELSMHIDWQKKLVRSMANLNPTAQLILATHSPEIMAEVPDENIFSL